MPRFYAPYNFVPITGECNGVSTTSVNADAIAQGSSEHPARHDLWQAGRLSGRVLCAATTTSPLVIGAQQEPHEPHRGHDSATRVNPYRADDGRPAIPASSLRGLIGSIAETLSQSAVRVLQDRKFSVRKPADAKSALSAVGHLKIDTAGSIRIQPLSFPIFYSGSPVAREWLRVYGLENAQNPAQSIAMLLPAYLSAYEPAATGIQRVAGSFLAQPIESSKCSTRHWYAHRALPILNWNAATQSLRYRDHPAGVLVARINGNPTQTVDALLTQGMIKSLGIAGHEDELPRTKKHELFIFVPIALPRSLPLTRTAVSNFDEVFEEVRARCAYLPFTNQGSAQGLTAAAHEQQLVFFDVVAIQGVLRVSEISFSSIWRRRVPGSLYGALGRIGPDLVPLDNARNALTPAELLFGVVREEKRDTELAAAQHPAFQALASRLRFSDGQAAPGAVLQSPPVKLQILSSPKPPSPSMYFSQQSDGVQPTKSSLDLRLHNPNGRKFYLPFPANQRTTANARSNFGEANLDKQKLVVEPINSGQTFYFEIRYENLSPDELGLLLTSLRPSVDFEHRLGLGRPLGFGHVRIGVLALQDRERPKRYTAEDFLNGKNDGLAFADPSARPTSLPVALSDWQSLFTDISAATAWDSNAPRPSLGTQGLVDLPTLAILSTLGNVNKLEPGVPVQYPRCHQQLNGHGQPLGEDKLFAWFVANDRAAVQQGLPRVSADGSLPTLNSNQSANDH